MEKMNMIEYFARQHGIVQVAADEKLKLISNENHDKWMEIYEEWRMFDVRREKLDLARGTLLEYFAYSNYLTDEEAKEQLQKIEEEAPSRYQEILDEFESWKPRFRIHKVQLELTDEEWEFLREQASNRGQSAGKLLETFVKDMYGERRQGSDEEDLAMQWYDRGSCNY